MAYRSAVRGLAAGCAALAMLSACDEDRATVFEPVSDLAYEFRTNTAAARNFPGGSVLVETLDTTSLGPPVTTVTASTRRLVLVLSNLKQLSAGRAYRVWLADSTGTVFRLARGKVHRIQVDTVAGVVSRTEDSSFSGLVQISGGGRANVTYRIKIRRGDLGGTTRADSVPFSHFLITIGDSSATDTTSGTGPTPLWRRYRGAGSALLNSAGTLSFGNFASPASGQLSVTYTPVGLGTGYFREDEVMCDFVSLLRAPQGYAYRMWIVMEDSSSFLVGGLTAPFPRRDQSLDGADSAQVDEVVTPTGIRQATARNFGAQMGLPDPAVSGYGYYRDVARIYLTLEPKLSDMTQRGPTLINSGSAPGIIARAYEEP